MEFIEGDRVVTFGDDRVRIIRTIEPEQQKYITELAWMSKGKQTVYFSEVDVGRSRELNDNPIGEMAATERGTFENQFNRKMNQLIKAVKTPSRIRLRDVIDQIEELDVKNRRVWVNRIVEEFSEDVSMKTLLKLKKRERR